MVVSSQEWSAGRSRSPSPIRQLQPASSRVLHLVIDASKHFLKAQLNLSKKKGQRVEVYEKLLKFMKEIPKITETQNKVGRVSKAAFASSLYEQLDAEIELEREQMR